MRRANKITLSELRELHALKKLKGTWKAVAKFLGVSERHLRRIRAGERGYVDRHKKRVKRSLAAYSGHKKIKIFKKSKTIHILMDYAKLDFPFNFYKVHLKEGNLYHCKIIVTVDNFTTTFTGHSKDSYISAYKQAYAYLRDYVNEIPDFSIDSSGNILKVESDYEFEMMVEFWSWDTVI